MKILYFHQHFSSPSGSTGIRSYGMARCLVKRGHEVTMICGSYLGSSTGVVGPFVNGQRRGLVDGIDVVEFELAYANTDGFIKRSATFLKYVLRGVKLVFTEKYDLVFATTTPLTAGVPGIVARWLRNKPFIFEVRDLWPELPKAMGVITNPFVLGLMSMLEWLSYHSAHHLVALAPGIARGIEKRGVVLNKISLIPNGCDLDIFDAEVEAWRPDTISDTDLLVLFAGTHGIANGLDSVLDAASELNSRGRRDIKFLFLGQGKLKRSLMDRATREGLDNVVFHDPVDKNRLAGLMSSTDVGLQILANIPVFYYGTSPNKFFDYISAGVPVLNNYPGWLAELINDNGCGFTVPPGDPIAFADMLERAAGDRRDLKVKGSKAKALAIEQFDKKILASQWVDQVETVHMNNIKR
ncbi:glycosyltransferase family 4 protein [Alphaproteobacteria bacterium]|nr:glycosyltransferase family 4 protein [Alphaproteobacteria bacterium]